MPVNTASVVRQVFVERDPKKKAGKGTSSVPSTVTFHHTLQAVLEGISVLVLLEK